MSRLSDEAIQERLAALGGWERIGDELCKQYGFDTYRAAVTFVNRVAGLAEEQAHHPDILLTSDSVTLTLSSHDVGGLTERDFRLAARIDS